MEVVKFNDGTYGVRKRCLGIFNYVYLDIKSMTTKYISPVKWWWWRHSMFFNDCKGDLNLVKSALMALHEKKYDYGTPVPTEEVWLSGSRPTNTSGMRT